MNMLQNPFSTDFYKAKLQTNLLSRFHDFHTYSLKMMLKIGWLAAEARPGVRGLKEVDGYS